jgi:hypothetical protein
MEKLVVAVELVLAGNVHTAIVRLGEPCHLPLATPLVGSDGKQYIPLDIVVDTA